MNTRFSYNLLQVFTKKRPAGFALPLVIMTGTVILVVGAAMMVKGTNDRNQVISQKAKASSMAATETGLTRIQGIMNDVKFVALYPMSDWTSAMTLSNDKSTVTLTSGSALATKVNQIAAATACSSAGGDVTAKESEIRTKLAKLLVATNSTMTDIDPNDSSKGKYKIVGYTYTGTPGTMPTTTQTGGLIIQGENGGSGSNSASRVAVDMPISGASGGVSSSEIVPGLWLKKGGINDGDQAYETSATTLANNGSEFKANIYFTDCDSKLSDSYISAVQTERVQSPATTATKTSLPFPSLPYQPTGAVQEISTPTTLDGSGQTEVNGVFHYVINNTNTANSVLVSPAIPGTPEVQAKAAVPEVQAKDAVPEVQAKAAVPEVQAKAAVYKTQCNAAGKNCKQVLVSPAVAYQPAQPAVAYQPAQPAVAYQPAQPAVAYQPAVPAVPAVYSSAVTVSPPTGKQIYVYNYLADISAGETFPRNKDIQSSDGKYRYKIAGNINLGGSDSVVINTDSNLGVIFYLNGDMVFKGSPDLTVNCSATSTAAEKAACSSKFQVYGYKKIVGSVHPEICLKGNADLYGYILAPDYDLGKTGNGAWYGSLFGQSWGKIKNCGSNNGKVAVTQAATWSQIPGEIKPSTFSPTLGNFTAYKTQPVQ